MNRSLAQAREKKVPHALEVEPAFAAELPSIASTLRRTVSARSVQASVAR